MHSDFQLELERNLEEEEIKTMLLDPRTSAYCFHFLKRRIDFIETSPDRDIYAAPFFYDAQYREAKSLISVPIEILQKVLLEFDIQAVPAFVFSTGRCGSTLLSNLIGFVPEVLSISEPDILTNLCALVLPDGSQDSIIQSFLKLAVELFLVQTKTKSVLFKFRSEVNILLPFFHSAFPKSKLFFMFRNGESTTKSFFQVAQPMIPLFEHRQDLIRQLIPIINTFKAKEERFSADDVFALFWLGSMDMAQKFQQSGIPIHGISYEILLNRTAPVIEELCSIIDVSVNQDQLKDACALLEIDSQKDTFLAEWKSDLPQEKVSQVIGLALEYLDQHPSINNFDFALSNTVQGVQRHMLSN